MKRTEILEDVSKAGIAWLLLIRSFVLVIVLPSPSSLVGIPVGALNENAAHLVSIIFNVPIIVIAIRPFRRAPFDKASNPSVEVDRYQQYRSAVQAIMEQFDEADTVTKRISVMRQMERLAFDEMRS